MERRAIDVAEALARLSEVTIFELRGEWRRLHRMPPPMRLSRDLLIRGITYKLQERAYGGLSMADARKLEQATADPPGCGAAKPNAADLLEARHAARAGMARGHPYGPRPCRRHRVARSALPLPLRGRAKDHRRPLVRPAVLRPRAAAAGLYFNCETSPWPGLIPREPGSPSACAIYTRKSSDEGLDQEFNSLDAQREACEAYIVSQRHAGWVALADMYDDGGLSGGSWSGLRSSGFWTDITAGKVQIIVVYKVDRLTRSLADFAKIVDVLDAHDASFVSVTQQFNTTTSMGRLTLNMLLSFAQFEREIAGERIRDKIGASKKKGMWMGGNVPLGYGVKDRKLVVNEPEAATVRLIFKRYAELGSVALLKAELDQQDIVSKRREGSCGRLAGGQHFSRGALYLMLQNRLYQGDIVHQGVAYQGQHEAILDLELWQIVQNKLAVHRQERALAVGAEAPSLVGRFDRRCRRQSDDADPRHKGGQAIPLLRLGIPSGGRSPASPERNARPGGGY